MRHPQTGRARLQLTRQSTVRHAQQGFDRVLEGQEGAELLCERRERIWLTSPDCPALCPTCSPTCCDEPALVQIVVFGVPGGEPLFNTFCEESAVCREPEGER